jgi:hypothetical protein
LPAKGGHFPLELADSPAHFQDRAIPHRNREVSRSYQLLDFGRKAHASLDSDSSPDVADGHVILREFREPVVFRIHPGLGVTADIGSGLALAQQLLGLPETNSGRRYIGVVS